MKQIEKMKLNVKIIIPEKLKINSVERKLY